MSLSSYTAFNLLLVDPTNTYQAGGVFDGRYIYFGHFGQPPTLGSTIIRYDTTMPFNSPSSYTCLGIGQAINYRGVVTDGRYVYFVPSDNTNSNSSGTIVRIDAYPGPQATAMIASQAPNGFAIGSYAGNITPYAGQNAPLYGNLIVGGQVGVNTLSPRFDMDVSGTINVSQTFLTGLLGSTIDNQNINLAEGNNQGGLGGGSVGTNKPLSLATTAFYDLTQGGTQPLSSFGGGVFDGRYIYFVPSAGTVARYDTSLPFSSSGSYNAYNLTKLNSLAQGFWGGLYDGQYVYFLPVGNSSIAPVIVQYNSALPFNSAASYTVFALTSIGVPSNAGFGGGVFDGRYIYLSPATGNILNPNSSTIVRYDTTGSFNATGSYSTFNIRTIATGLTEYFGAVYDGRYVYFMPYLSTLGTDSGSIMRYDTTLPFSAASSYLVYQLQSVSEGAYGYFGGIFDGRYVYLIPTGGPLFARYDTMQPFQSAGSYTTFAIQSLIDLSNAGGYTGGVFDGRYIYMGQLNFFGNDSRGSTIVRYDTTLPFAAPSSYTCIGTGQTLSYRGAVFDGQYVYFVPASTGSGTIVRIDAYPGPQATAMAAYQAPNGFVVGDYVGTAAPLGGSLLVSDNLGIGTNNPQYTLDVNGTIQTIAITPINSQPVYANGATTRNQLITLAEGYNQGFGSGSVGTNKQMSVNASAAFDLTASAGPIGYVGAVFDGRYVYLVPGNAVFGASPNSSTLTRYDTTLPLSNINSYTCFDLTRIDPSCKGYLGGVYDGRYVYLTPQNTATITRYDTFQNFNAASSYTSYDLLNIGVSGTLNGATFDGQYIYFTALTAVLTRYDTTLPINSPDSYLTKLLPPFTIGNFNKYSFQGCIYDGRYIYLAPTRNVILNSTIVRYDTTLPFIGNTSSYTGFDLKTLSSNVGGVGAGTFDGRYVYFMSNFGLNFSLDSSTIVRYDTQQNFNLPSSYTIFNTLQVYPTPIIFNGAVFDGRYIYFLPMFTSAASVVIRYDTTLGFNIVSSYTALNTASINSLSLGFFGGVFDGRYVYLAPYTTSTLTRLDTYPGPQATAIAASQAPNGLAVGTYAGAAAANGNLIISGNFGIGTATPTFSLQLGVGASAKPGAGGLWSTTSDVRIKTNIQDVSGSLNMIRQLRPRKYRFRLEYAKDIQIDPHAFYYGFVADEVEGVVDGCVSTSDIHCYGGKGSQAASPEPLPDLMNLKTLNIHNILVHSIQAIKELADRSDQLKEQIDDL